MRFIKKHLSLWRIVLIIGLAAIAIPIAVRVRATGRAVVNLRHENLAPPAANENEDTANSKAAAGRGVGRPQDDDYYDRRREYWDKRVERRLDRREEYLDDQTKDDDKDADAKDKDSKADADDDDDEDDNVDREVERRREYWRKRLDRDW
jgi:hypothetical protein